MYLTRKLGKNEVLSFQESLAFLIVATALAEFQEQDFWTFAPRTEELSIYEKEFQCQKKS